MATGSRREQDAIDNPIERLELLAGDDDAVAAYLDEIDVHSPREREMLSELARTEPLADAAGFPAAHHRAIAALESLGRHGYHGSRSGARLGPARVVVRFLVQLVARFVVVAYLRDVSNDLRNLYWLREMEARDGSRENKLLRAARIDADGLTLILKRRQLGLPTFVIGGAIVPLTATGGRVGQGVAFGTWWAAVMTGLVSALIVVGASWVILRGAAMASRRIELSAVHPLQAVWTAIGNCGQPPRNQSRQFALVAISLTAAAWLLIPLAVALAFAL